MTQSGGGSSERIISVELQAEMKKSFIDYAMSVIVSRAIPDVRDGMKPVHRRIIYGMYELNLSPSEKFKKSARVVGDVMGKYHPHGDSAIYEALVRLAQPGSSRYVLINGHGNFGDLDNPPAAMRYTEAKLAPLAMDTLADIEAETIDMRPNFDGTQMEPSVLPSRVPVLLLNGSSGIAVGMATNIPPHNLTEVINGTIAKIDNPDLTSTQLMQWVKGPDFPSGGIILGTEGIIEAYTTGRGSVPVRGEATIEQIPGSGGRQSRMAIVVTSLPYMVGPEAFTKRVADLVRDEKLTGISDVNDETDRTGMRVVIELKRDAHPEVVLNNIYKHTQLQSSFAINTLALVRGRPATLQLSDMLQEFIDHRIDVVTRRTRYFLRKAEERAHILEGYLIAMGNIDEVIRIIRASNSTEEARVELIGKFNLSETQANAILELQLRRLTGMERSKVEKDHAELLVKIADYKDILENRQRVLNIIKDELVEVRDSFKDMEGNKDERRTKIEAGASDTELSAKDLTPNEPMAIFITKQDYIKRISLDSFRRQRRNTRGVTGMKTRDEDDLQHFFVANMHDRLLVFTNRGQVYSLEVMDLPEGGRSAKGLALVNLLPISQDETVTTVIPVTSFDPDSYLIMLTHQAYIKKVQMSEFANIRRSGIIAITLNDGDQLGWVRPSTGKSDVIIGTGDGMCIRYSEEELRPLGRSARGVRAITLRDGDRIVGFDAIETADANYVLVVTNDGYGKRVRMDEFRQQGRGGIGLIGTKFKFPHSRLASLRVVHAGEEMMIATANGVVVRQKIDDISIQGRMATGVRLQQLADDDSVVSVTPIVEPSPEADSAEEGRVDEAKGGEESGEA
ncbi:MAG: DNA gyrase subunit A [Candidatus Obscuribacter phosphatis]|uniref:DNA gyrase subunit A n=1 Tax=Candidatus Obscuribacter phosphatis TaxID=1906157 RepID=A0A8J7TKP3_9BACT|nr:DNA gyrase subunit A [Candidatus Obscuribacter phosphatis]